MAISWQLRGNLISAELSVKPHFAGCEPLGYRDRGFRAEPHESGGRLCWLPHLLGPKIVADTNGEYREEPFQFTLNRLQTTVSPGTFEFQLARRSFDSDILKRYMRAKAVQTALRHVLGWAPRSELRRTSGRSVTAKFIDEPRAPLPRRVTEK